MGVVHRKLQHFQTQNILIKSVGGAMLLEAWAGTGDFRFGHAWIGCFWVQEPKS